MAAAARTSTRRFVRSGLVTGVLVALAAMFLTGCGDDDADRRVRGSGQIVERSRDVSEIDAVELRGRGRMTIEIGEAESLSITADDNLLALVTSEVVDGRLIVDVDPAVDPTEELEFAVTVTELVAVGVAGSGSISTGGLDGESFEIAVSGSGRVAADVVSLQRLRASISGSGQIEVDGTARNLEVSVSGSGHFAGAGLEAGTGTVLVSGSGMATVDVVDDLTAEVSGSGIIEYLGEPALASSVSGSGQVRPG